MSWREQQEAALLAFWKGGHFVAVDLIKESLRNDGYEVRTIEEYPGQIRFNIRLAI